MRRNHCATCPDLLCGIIRNGCAACPGFCTGASNYGFSGELTDPSQLVYLRARYYQPSTGRFISRDTWGGNVYNPQSINRWSYAVANPVMFVDPSGRKFLYEEDEEMYKERIRNNYPIHDSGESPESDKKEKDYSPYYDSGSLRSQQLSDQLQLALIYYGEMQNGKYVYHDQVPYGTTNSQYKIKTKEYNLCLLVAAASRFRQIIGTDFSANELFEMYLERNPGYTKSMLGAWELEDMIINTDYLSSVVSIMYRNSWSIYGDNNTNTIEIQYRRFRLHYKPVMR